MTTQNKSGDKTRSELQQKRLFLRGNMVTSPSSGIATAKELSSGMYDAVAATAVLYRRRKKRTEVEDYNTMTRLQPRSHHVLSDHLADIEMTDQLQLTSTNVRCHPLDASHKLQITRDQTVSPLVSFIHH